MSLEKDVVICPICKTENPSTSYFCANCGQKLMATCLDYENISDRKKSGSYIMNFLTIAFILILVVMFLGKNGLINTDKVLNTIKKTQASSSNMNKSTPTQTNTSNKVTNQFTQTVQPLPESGTTYKYFTGEGIAPLGVKTQSGDLNYFIKVADWDTKKTVLTIFIRSGESASVKLPLGNYEFKYATGKNWYGPDYLFGPDTSYYVAETKMNFYQSGNSFHGQTVELIPRAGGNLKTDKISKNSF